MAAIANYHAEDEASPLAEMDLTAPIITQAVSDGLVVALSTRELAPPATAGFNM